jgi:DNA-binding transcriptional ArsR family regulator
LVSASERGAAAPEEAAVLVYIPVRFDLYRTVRPALRWTLQNLVGFADRAGKCWPSVRKLADVVGISKSSVSRHLAALERAGILTRQRKPGGCYSYRIDSRFLPAQREVSHKRDRAVPPARTEEKSLKKTSDFHDDSAQWRARLGAWQSSGGRFWNPFWGPKPSEPDCWAPKALLQIM